MASIASQNQRDGKTQSDLSKATNGLRNHQQGAAAELALIKFLGMKWNATVNTYNSSPDLDGYLECRSKQDAQKYLRLYSRSDSTKGFAVFASLTRLRADLSSFRIDGWTHGADAMNSKYFIRTKYNRDEWQCPLDNLRSPATLRTETVKRLDVVIKGRKKMRTWVKETLEHK